MILFVTVKTNLKDAYIDFIEITTPSKLLTLDWDESDITRTDYGFSARYKGVYFNGEYANKRINELKHGFISDVQIYSEQSVDNPRFEFMGDLEFTDEDKRFLMSENKYPNIYFEKG